MVRGIFGQCAMMRKILLPQNFVHSQTNFICSIIIDLPYFVCASATRALVIKQIIKRTAFQSMVWPLWHVVDHKNPERGRERVDYVHSSIYSYLENAFTMKKICVCETTNRCGSSGFGRSNIFIQFCAYCAYCADTTRSEIHSQTQYTEIEQ